MTEFNSYPVFVADQVLSAGHLNEIVNYLDEQERLTRNKLIGIGIACGLELRTDASHIAITQGCGVTSAGYLIVLDALSLQYYRPYALPADFFPKYKAVYEDWNMWELLSAEDSLKYDDVVPLKGHGQFLRDKIVVLLLEMKSKLLKNCVDADCDDKGKKIEFVVRPLLVRKADIDEFLKGVEDSGAHEHPPQQLLPNVLLRRFNVPVNALTSSDVVLNGFLELVDDAFLKRITEALNTAYLVYSPILADEPTNPFQNVYDTLRNTLSVIKNSNPLFIQYFYDWIDDVIKAYNEFKNKTYDLQVMCCPPEGLFPLHLMLGEANRSTTFEVRSNYRNYFIHSPLFNQRSNMLDEVQSLFKRLKVLISNYKLPNVNTFSRVPIRITPGSVGDAPLSNRCIPYYYEPFDLYPFWSWDKTRRGYAKGNLSYNASAYSSEDAVVRPLLYDIEPYNFFRIEGHIGKHYTNAVSDIVGQRNQFNLPFELVSLSTATVARYIMSEDKDCIFKDLESLYNVIIAEMICRFGDVACMWAGVKYSASPRGNVGTIGGLIAGDLFARESRRSVFDDLSRATGISPAVLDALGNFSLLKIPNYKKGDFIRSHCTISAGTVGEAYLKMVEGNFHFVKPSPDSQMNLNTVYAHLFYFIDCVENVMSVCWQSELKDLQPSAFNTRFDDLTEEARTVVRLTPTILENAKELNLDESLRRFPGLTHTCFDERLEALKKEFEKRKAELQALINFMNYFRKHPGMEHKAGVPKGGTFILVYHETPRRKTVRPNLAGSVLTSLPRDFMSNLGLAADIDYELLTSAAVKDPELLRRFEVALGRYLDSCKDMDEETKVNIKDVLVAIPGIRVPTKFQIPEFSVIADFYLPFICCSDCPPMTYVLPKVEEGVLSINITPTAFCNNDSRAYPVMVTPSGGSLSASAGGVEPGKLEFRPSGLAAGVNKLTYTLADGRSAAIDVTVTELSKVDFRFNVQNDGVTVAFKPGRPGTENLNWDFGDGTTSTEREPKHTYQFGEGEKTFTVKLSALEGPCVATATHDVKLVKPQRSLFGIIPEVFSFTDTNSHSFTTVPAPQNLNQIKNTDGLKLDLSSAGDLSFVPEKQGLKESKAFNLEYMTLPLVINVIVANADFIMNLFTRPPGQEVILALKAKQEKADKYEWTLSVNNRTLNFSGRELEISYNKLDVGPRDEIKIRLLVGHNVPGAACEAEATFTITPVVLKKMLNKGEFDNHMS
jgi:hypothetical protein